MRRPPAESPADVEVPATVPLSVVLKHRHRRHVKAMAMGYLIGLVIILMAFATHNVIVFGLAVAVTAKDAGDRVCGKQGCQAFGKGRRS